MFFFTYFLNLQHKVEVSIQNVWAYIPSVTHLELIEKLFGTFFSIFGDQKYPSLKFKMNTP